MDKKNKIIIISVCAITLIIIGIIIYFMTRNVAENSNENKLEKLYNKMIETETYSILFKLNEENQYTISRKANMANVDRYSNGTHTTDIVRDGNTILLMYNTNKYFTYQNNEIELTELTYELEEIIQSQSPEKGEETIEGKKFKYEEYKGVSYFLMDSDEEVAEEDTNTRFYFKGDDLIYIRTIMGDQSELIEVNVSDEVDDSIFEIPSSFEEG